MRGFSETGKTLPHAGMLFEVVQRHERADGEFFRVECDAIEAANVFEIDQTRRTRCVVFHRGQQILAAGDWSRSFVDITRRSNGEHLHGFVNVCRISPLKGFHICVLELFLTTDYTDETDQIWDNRFLSKPIKILSGVIGSSRMRKPVALKTAFTSAPKGGMMQPSAIPITASRLSSSSMIGTISGISKVPGNL